MTSLDTPASSGVPGPGEMSTASGSRATISSSVQLVVAVHERLGAELAQVLDEVVDEAVVVVDDQHRGSATATTGYASPVGPSNDASTIFRAREHRLEQVAARAGGVAARAPMSSPSGGARP